jgi:two-component system, OmpR family, response regulator
MMKRKILIIDDEPGFTHMVRLTLEKTGFYEVKEENKSQLALSDAHEFKPDLVLLDVLMPGMDGGDIAAKLKADPEFHNIPVIFLTATVPKREATSGGSLVSGGFVFLAKPVGIKELVQCIEDNLKLAKPQ